jgi:hypothetical protein
MWTFLEYNVYHKNVSHYSDRPAINHSEIR